MIQALFDGVLVGAVLSLGAIGLTLVMHILRFANFSHAELLAIGAYAALTIDGFLAALSPPLAAAIGDLSMTAALAIAMLAATAVAGASAILIDMLVFRRLRDLAGPLTMVIASFGVALVVRSTIALVYGLKTERYTDDIAFAVVVSTDPFLLIKPDQIVVLGIALVAMFALHLLLTRTTIGYALRAVAENPILAQVNGIPLDAMIRLTWILGAALASTAGVLYAIDNQLSPVMGRDLVLSLFAAAIVGGLGSVTGAMLGGLIVGLASSFSLLVLPAGYKPVIPFLIIMATLYVRPSGLFGEAR